MSLPLLPARSLSPVLRPLSPKDWLQHELRVSSPSMNFRSRQSVPKQEEADSFLSSTSSFLSSKSFASLPSGVDMFSSSSDVLEEANNEIEDILQQSRRMREQVRAKVEKNCEKLLRNDQRICVPQDPPKHVDCPDHLRQVPIPVMANLSPSCKSPSSLPKLHKHKMSDLSVEKVGATSSCS